MAVKLSKASLLPSLNNDRSDELNFRKDEIEHFENLLKFAASICPSSVEPKTSSQQVEDIEKAIYKLSEWYSLHNCHSKLETMIKSSRGFLTRLSKSKSGKLMRTMVGSYLDMEGITVAIAIDLCKDCVEWCQKEKRSFLRQSVECRLIALYLENKSYTEALGLINKITKELKKLDDKALLAEVHLLESKAYHSLSNLTKSRSALTSARTAANAIYCPPRLQGALDLQSGILNAEEKDFKTAYSYFYETFECYDSSGEAELATTPLKYMLLSKIMLNLPEDVESIINNKICSKYAGKHMEAMKAVASSLRDRSLDKFKSVLAEYPNELSEDPIIVSHLTDLYETMFEQNLFRIIEPFSRVEIAHISALINIPVTVVEEKLSKMILDQKFAGVLDQRAGCLIVYDSKVVDESYSVALQSIIHMNKVVDSLYAKAQQLTHWN